MRRTHRTLGRSLSRPMVAAVAVVGLLLAACTSRPPADDGLPPISPTGSPSPSASPAVPKGARYPLGTVAITSSPSTCPQGQSCNLDFDVTCPQVSHAARGSFQILAPEGSTKGLVEVFLGGMGTGFEHGEGVSKTFLHDLQADGFEVVVVLWVDSWLEAAQGEQVGPARLACRSATTVKWAYDNLFLPLHVASAGTGVCGFCLTGNSGGSSQIGYTLSFYGLAGVVNAAILSGGPPHAAIAKGCLRAGSYTYIGRSAQFFDDSYGFVNGGGPCSRHDASFQARWDQDSVDLGGKDYDYTTTRVMFLFGTADDTVGPAHGKDYEAKLVASRSPMVSMKEVPGVPHEMSLNPTGRAALEAAILGTG